MKLLTVLLGASVLFNIVLVVRRPAAPEPSPRRPAAPLSSRGAEPAPAAPRLEEPWPPPTSPRATEPEKPPRAEAVATPDRLAVFREKLARTLRHMKDGRALANDPEAHLELREVSLAFQRAKLDRWKDPKTYVDMLEAIIERATEETKAPLRDDQKAELRRTLEDYEAALGGMTDADAFERFLREAGPEADMLQKLRAFVTPEQERRVMVLGHLSPWSASTAPWVDRNRAEAQAVQLWTAAYGLDESQKAAARAAARVYVTAADALNGQLGRDALPGRETPEWRRRTAQILLDALASLESSLGPEQRERLRRRRPAELRVFDPAAVQRYAR